MNRFQSVCKVLPDCHEYLSESVLLFSGLDYLWTFIGQTDYLPDLMESLGSIKDLNIRFEQDGQVNSDQQSVLV